MDQIVLNTSQLKKQKDTLNSRKDYYTGKVSTFQGSKYNASSTLSSLLSKIRTNYTTIGSNIQNVSKYLEDYYKDAEGIEYKFNHSGGSIQTSSVNTIANEYYDVIEKYEFPTQDYFKLSFADSITSAVNNFFTFRKVVETDSVNFMLDDSLYNDVLDIYTEQIDMSIEEYETVAQELEKEIDSFASVDSLISNGTVGGLYSIEEYHQKLHESLDKFGFSSLEEYQQYISELKSSLATCEEAIRQLELSKIAGKYDCLLFAEDFQGYSYHGEISEEEIRNLSGTMNEYSPLSFDYDKIYGSHEEISLMAYVATLSKMYDESTIKAYATDEVWNAYELLEASNISQVENVSSSDYLVGANLVNAYNYLFERYGKEEASQYLKDMEDRVNQILGQSEAMEKLAKLSSEDDIFSVVGNEVYVAGTGIGDGVQSWGENMGHAVSAIFSFFSRNSEESRAMTKEEYEAQFFMQGLQQGNYSGPFLVNNYEISQGIGNMLPSILISRGLGAAGVAASTASSIGSATIGVSSFGGSYHSSMVEGYSKEQALTYGLISGSSEALFEKFLGGVLSDVRIVDGKSYLYSMAKEATEEGFQNVFDAGVRNVLFGEVQTEDELVESTLKSMLYGGITAGILNSPSAISNSVKSAKVKNAINKGSLDITNVVTSLKNSGLDIEFEGKTDTQIISENADIVYDMFKEQVVGVDNAIDSFNSQISNMNEEARTDNYNITKEKNSLDFKQYINNYLQKVSNFKFSDINFSERLKNLGDSIYSYFSGNYEIGTSDMTFENLDSQAELISDTLSYSDVDQLKNLLDSGQEGDLAKVLVDGTLTANLDQNISNKALENFNRSSETLIKFFKTTLKNIKNANQVFANMLAKATKLDSVESENLNGNLLGKFVGTFGYEFLSGTLMNKRKFTPVTNSKIMLDTIQNDGILHFTSPSTADKIMESGMIKKSGILTSDMTSPKSFFFGGTPTFEDLLINVPAYDVMTAVKIHPTAEQISQLKYRPLNDRAVVYDGDFHFDPGQAEIVYYGLAYDKENNNIFLKQITKEEAQNYHVSEEVKSAYNYNIKGNSLVDEIKMNIYGLYAEYKHHQRLQQFVAQWEQKGIKLNEISDQELYDLWNIKQSTIGIYKDRDMNNSMSSYFNQLPSNLQDYLKNIALNTDSDYLSLKTLSDLVYNGLHSTDPNVQIIINNLPKLNEFLDVEFHDTLDMFRSRWSNENNALHNEYAVVYTEVGNSSGVFAHELGHGLFELIHNKTVPSEYDSIRETVLSKWNSNSQELESFLNEAREFKEKMWVETIEEAKKWLEQNDAEINQEINNAFLDSEKLNMLLIDSAKKRHIPENKITQEVETIKSLSKEEIIDYIHKGYLNEYISNNFYYKCDNDATGKIYEAVTGMIDSLYQGENPYYETIYENGFLRSHTPNYFFSDKSRGFDEQIADFCRIKLDNSPVAYQICQKLFGPEWIGMMEQEFSSLASDLSTGNFQYDKNKKSDFFSGIFNQDSDSMMVSSDDGSRVTAKIVQDVNATVDLGDSTVETLDTETYIPDPNIIHVDSINDLSLDSLSKMEDLTQKRFEYNGYYYSSEDVLNVLRAQDKNISTLQDEILNTISMDFNDFEKIRKCYIELNKRLHYNSTYAVTHSDPNSVEAMTIYNTPLAFSSLTDNHVICKGWSELYQELLISAGISKERISIVGYDKGHRWVVIDFGENVVIADATDSILHTTDLANCKYGMPTVGMIYTNASRFNDRILNSFDENTLHSSSAAWKEIDKSIGYTTNAGYFSETLNKAKGLFKNSKIFNKLMNQGSMNHILELFIGPVPKGLDGNEYYQYLQTLKNMLKKSFDFSSNDISVQVTNRKTILGYEWITTGDININNKPLYIVYSESIGKRTFTDIHEYYGYLSTLKLR